MTFLRSRRGRMVLAVVVVLCLFLIRPGANRLRTRIAGSISLALGRPVDISSVSLRLLPRPGFDLENFVVHEDPAFGSEPVLRADEVTAALRVTSLLRGRLEISRLILTEPSLNLVQDSAGHWNLENLLERAAKTPVAPTGKSKREVRPGFPYIEADRGRINFKFGAEKKPYALTEADFSVWQDSENAWGMRLRARPLRTDFNLSDTGTVRVAGTWQRAVSLRDTPVQFNLQWDRAQLGQVTKLAYGRDEGWRGAITIFATLSGTPGDLKIASSATVDDFRRYDLPGGDALQLAAQCSARYSSINRDLPNLSCHAPMDGGFLALEGSIAGPTGARAYELAIDVENVPMQSLVAVARHTKKDIPDDLIANGRLDGAFTLHPQAAWQGKGEARGLRIGLGTGKVDSIPDRIPFILSSGSGSSSGLAARRLSAGLSGSEPRIEIGPFNLALGRPLPAVAHVSLSRSGYSLQLRGDAQLQRLLRLAHTVGLPAAQPAADGVARVDLQITGDWSAFSSPQTLGRAQLRAVRAQVRGVNEPLQIASADVALTPAEVRMSNVSASVGETAWRGSFSLPRSCGWPVACLLRFDLSTSNLSGSELTRLLKPGPGKQPWYGFLASTPQSGGSYLLNLHAAGSVTANTVAIGKLEASNVSATLEIENGKLHLTDLRADLLGGRHTGEWDADFSAKPPTYRGSGSLEKIDLEQLAETMRDDWITGTGAATYRITASGSGLADLISSANASVQVQAVDGTLPHIELASDSGALRIRKFEGQLLLRDGIFEIEEGKLDTSSGIYQVGGTASLGRELNVKLTRSGAHGFQITGTLPEPRVAETVSPETQAALKP